MARNKFELIYHDGSRRQMTLAERNSFLLSRDIKQIGPTRFLFIGQPRTFHSFADLAQLLPILTLRPNLLRHYLEALCVIFELRTRRDRQFEETPEAFALRLEEMGWLTN